MLVNETCLKDEFASNDNFEIDEGQYI